MTTTRITGSCQCGAIRYETDADPVMAGHCHCNACKKSSGAGHASALFVPKESFEVFGNPTSYESEGGSGKIIKRYFCPTCGSRLYGEPLAAGNIIGIMAGTLDDPEQFSPQFQIYTEHRTTWDPTPCDGPEFPAGPQS